MRLSNFNLFFFKVFNYIHFNTFKRKLLYEILKFLVIKLVDAVKIVLAFSQYTACICETSCYTQSLDCVMTEAED